MKRIKMKSKKTKNVAVFPGSFNPVHPGHLTTIYQATKIFDKVIVLVASNPDKNYSVPAKTRMTWIKNFFKDTTCEKKISYDVTDKGLTEYCESNGITTVIRGFRNQADIDFEESQREYNNVLKKKIGFELKYVYFAADKRTKHLSSTAVKQFLKFADVKQFSDLFFNACWTTGTELRQKTLKEILDAYHG